VRIHRNLAVLGALAVLACLAWACAPPLTPEEEVISLRSKYEAELKSFTVTQEPQEGEELGVPDGEAPEHVAEEVAADVVEPPAPRVKSDALLDILVSTTSEERLPGLTVEVQQVGADGKEKAAGLLWVDTSTLGRGSGIQVTHVLEDIDYEAGDGFWVGVRGDVPVSERGKYKEFPAP